MKRGRRYLLLVLGVIMGALFCMWGKLYSDYNSKQVFSNRIIEELGNDEFVLAVGNPDDHMKVSVDMYTSWFYCEDYQKYYLLLPKAWENNNGICWIFNTEESILLDGKKILKGATFQAKAGNHTVKVNDEEYPLEIMYSSKIATMFMETTMGDLEYIHESKEIIDSAEYIMYDEQGRLNSQGNIDEIACRGNVSFKFVDKKSYRFKLSEKTQILDMGEGKNWNLIANVLDVTISRNMIANTLAHRLDLDYVPDMRYVDVYANGEYIGNYVLSEKIEIDAERVNIQDLSELTELANPGLDLSTCEQVIEQPGKLFSRKWWKIPVEPEDYTGGYLMEIEMSDRYGLEASGFISSRMQAVVVHSPKYASLNQITYMADMYQDFEDALFSEDGYNENTGKYFYEYINMDSFAKKYMLEEVIKNLDASVTSCYIYKPEYDSVMYAGPAWDYDGAINIDRIAGNGVDLKDPEGLYVASREDDGESDIWWGLYRHDVFRKKVSEIFDSGFKTEVSVFIDTFIDENREMIFDSAMMNAVRWYQTKDEGMQTTIDNFNMRHDELKDFLNARLDWLTKEWDYN